MTEQALVVKQDKEANAFACALLMPKDMFLKEWKRLERLHDEDKRLHEMARIFQVPLFAVVMRIQMFTGSGLL